MVRRGTGVTVSVKRLSRADQVAKRIQRIIKLSAFVGIPADAKTRRESLQNLAGRTRSRDRQERIKKALDTEVSNAELLFIFSKGSPGRGQPPREVLEPAIVNNSDSITPDIRASMKAELAGDHTSAVMHMKRAAIAGQNAAREWFTDARNGWAPNAESTIAAKGSDRPGIDTGSMRGAIVGLVKEEP